MRRPSLCSITPWLLASGLLLASCGADPVPTVNGEAIGATSSPAAGSTEPLGVGTDAPDLTAPTAAAATDAPATEAPATDAPAPLTPDPCAGREAEAFIEVLAPTDGASVGTTFTIEGCGNTFEASWLWRVTLSDGTVVGDGFGTMSCGNGCVGTFSEDVTVTGTGAAILRVYEVSAQDSSEVNATELAITIS